MADEHPNILHGATLPLEIPELSLGQFVFSSLKMHNPYDVLMVEAETGRLVTPVEFLSLSMRVAEGLKESGLRPRDVVTIVAKSSIDVFATASGTLFQGATVSPVDPNLAPEVFRLIIKTVCPKFVFCDVDIAGRMTEVLSELDLPSSVILYGADPDAETQHRAFESFVKVEVDFRRFRPVPTEDPAESVAFLVCSSGTMGVPKPVMLTDRNLLYQATVWRVFLSFNKLLMCPAVTFSYFFWISGILLYMMNVCLNVEMTIVQKQEARHVLKVIDRQKPVWGMFAPALVKYLTWHPDFKNYNMSSMMLMFTGGTFLQKVVVDKVKELWGPHVSCRQSYGVTELSGSTTVSAPDDDVLSVGRILPGSLLKVVSTRDGTLLGPGEEGEIYVKSPAVMKGYLGNEKATKDAIEDGWYKTGDVGLYTEKGLVYITGRVRDLIRINNEFISPVEIEEVILAVPGVADAGVVGMPAGEETQVLVALVIKMPGHEVTRDDIVKSTYENLPEEKRIRDVFFVDFIPRTTSGKMKRTDLLNQAKVLYEKK